MSDSIVCEDWSLRARELEAREHDLFVGAMADYPHLEYSMKAVRRAGKQLVEDINWSPRDKAAILETFAIANSWRDSHVLPMRSVRFSVIQRMRRAGIGGFTAARPKRMSSIRKKLRRQPGQLDQINDLGGCRAVLDDIEAVNVLIDECRNNLPHELRQEYPYIKNPKPDGYRSHHMVFRFNGKDDRAAFDGRRIELQIRTRLQHSWATAVEAVGLFRGEDMKAGEGDPDWLRLFQLMSAEFAYSENCRPAHELPVREERVTEIRALNGKLRATGILEDLKNTTNFLNNFIHEPSRFYLIRYDHATHEVSVRPYQSALEGTARLGALERQIESEDRDHKVVLVEVGKVESLVEAYPNYFGDVSLFITNLKAICEGRRAIEYSMAPQSVVAPKPYEKPDPSWLKRRYRWK